MTKERRKKFSFRGWIVALFSGECQVCKRTTGANLVTCRRNHRDFIFVCDGCSRNFSEPVKMEERSILCEEDYF